MKIAMLTAAALLALAPAAFAETVTYKADLKASSEVPANDSKGSGAAHRDLRHGEQEADLFGDLQGSDGSRDGGPLPRSGRCGRQCRRRRAGQGHDPQPAQGRGDAD